MVAVAGVFEARFSILSFRIVGSCLKTNRESDCGYEKSLKRSSDLVNIYDGHCIVILSSLPVGDDTSEWLKLYTDDSVK